MSAKQRRGNIESGGIREVVRGGRSTRREASRISRDESAAKQEEAQGSKGQQSLGWSWGSGQQRHGGEGMRSSRAGPRRGRAGSHAVTCLRHGFGCRAGKHNRALLHRWWDVYRRTALEEQTAALRVKTRPCWCGHILRSGLSSLRHAAPFRGARRARCRCSPRGSPASSAAHPTTARPSCPTPSSGGVCTETVPYAAPRYPVPSPTARPGSALGTRYSVHAIGAAGRRAATPQAPIPIHGHRTAIANTVPVPPAHPSAVYRTARGTAPGTYPRYMYTHRGPCIPLAVLLLHSVSSQQVFPLPASRLPTRRSRAPG